MKRRARRTVLDDMIAQEIVDGLTGENLRAIASGGRPIERYTKREVIDLRMLLDAVMQPARGDTRRAKERDFAIALRHAHLTANGEPHATSAVAAEFGVSVRTVSGALRKHKVSMSRAARTPRDLEARKVWQPSAKNKRGGRSAK